MVRQSVLNSIYNINFSFENIFYLSVIGWLNRRLADNQSPSHNNASVPITVPSTVQLTLPRTNKVFGNRYETKTPGQGITQSNGPLSTLPLRNPIVQNPNINQTAPHR